MGASSVAVVVVSRLICGPSPVKTCWGPIRAAHATSTTSTQAPATARAATTAGLLMAATLARDRGRTWSDMTGGPVPHETEPPADRGERVSRSEDAG